MTQQARALDKRILLVEDDPAARESIKLLLKIDRHSVAEASNSAEALKLFAQEHFDLAIIDYFMPQIQGHELAAQLRHLAPNQPILMVTAFYEKLVDRGIPVNAILPKPFGIEELRAAVSNLVS
jgi:DNA-binding response OmpR family regulator